MRTVFCLHGRRTDRAITSFWTNHKFLVTKLPPIRHSFLSATLPLLLGQYSKLFDYFFGFHFFHLSIERWLLQFYNMVFFFLQILKYFLTRLLILFLKSGFGKSHLSIFCPFLVLFIPFKFSALPRLTHDSKVNFPFFRFTQSLVGLFDDSPSIFGFWILALIGMEHKSKCPILFFDFFIRGSCVQQ